MENVQSKKKVKLLCPQGHELFPNGISFVSLYKTYAVRLDSSQCVAKGYDWDRAYDKMSSLTDGTIDRVSFDKGRNKDVVLCPTYKVGAGQMKLLPACKGCLQ